MRDFFKFLRLTDRFRYFMILTVLRVPFETVRTILIAVFTQRAFDAIGAGSTAGLFRACLFYGMMNLLLFLYNGMVWSLYAKQHTKWIAAVRRKLFAHLSCLSLRQVETKESGDWMTNLNADVRSGTMIMGHPAHLHHAGAMLLSVLVSSVMLIRINPVMYLLILAFVMPLLLLSHIITKPMSRLAADAKEAVGENATDLSAVITCADTAILYDAGGLLLSRFEKSSREIRKKNMKIRSRRALLDGLLPFLGLCGYIALLAAGGMWIATGQMTFGELTRAFQYRGEVMMCALIFTTCIVNIKITLASIKRLNRTIDLPPEE